MKKLFSLTLLLSCSSIMVCMEPDQGQLTLHKLPEFAPNAHFMGTNGSYQLHDHEDFQGAAAALQACNWQIDKGGQIEKMNFTPLYNWSRESLWKKHLELLDAKSAVENERDRIKEEIKNRSFWEKHPRFTLFAGTSIGAGIMTALCWNGSCESRIQFVTGLWEKLRG